MYCDEHRAHVKPCEISASPPVATMEVTLTCHVIEFGSTKELPAFGKSQDVAAMQGVPEQDLHQSLDTSDSHKLGVNISCILECGRAVNTDVDDEAGKSVASRAVNTDVDDEAGKSVASKLRGSSNGAAKRKKRLAKTTGANKLLPRFHKVHF